MAIFKKKEAEDKKKCWADYLQLCKIGGSLGYKDALKAANLSLPFAEGSVAKITSYAKEILEKKITEK